MSVAFFEFIIVAVVALDANVVAASVQPQPLAYLKPAHRAWFLVVLAANTLVTRNVQGNYVDTNNLRHNLLLHEFGWRIT